MSGIDSYVVRLVIIHDLLPYRRGQKGRTSTELVRELASRGIAISARTVQRDLEAWSDVFGLRCERTADKYYWRRARKAVLSDHFLVDEYYGEPVDAPEEGGSPRYGNSSNHPDWQHEPERWMDI